MEVNLASLITVSTKAINENLNKTNKHMHFANTPCQINNS